MLEALRTEVLEANLEVVRRGLVIYTFGNASGLAREQGLVVIKPSGVPYDKMTPADMVITDLEGRVVEGTCARLRIWPRTSRFMAHSRRSAASSTRIRLTPPRGHRLTARSLASAPPTRTIFTARSP